LIHFYKRYNHAVWFDGAIGGVEKLDAEPG